jgi:hypothetical protein
MTRKHSFHGANDFADVHLTFTTNIYGTGWAKLKELLADDYECDPAALELTESYWGGEYGDDDGAELVIYQGKLIGAFNRRLLRADVALIESIPHFADVRKTTDAERATSAFKIAAE